ncbi:hypothetical protein [Streptomyces sp. NPDC015414]
MADAVLIALLAFRMLIPDERSDDDCLETLTAATLAALMAAVRQS